MSSFIQSNVTHTHTQTTGRKRREDNTASQPDAIRSVHRETPIVHSPEPVISVPHPFKVYSVGSKTHMHNPPQNSPNSPAMPHTPRSHSRRKSLSRTIIAVSATPGRYNLRENPRVLTPHPQDKGTYPENPYRARPTRCSGVEPQIREKGREKKNEFGE